MRLVFFGFFRNFRVFRVRFSPRNVLYPLQRRPTSLPPALGFCMLVTPERRESLQHVYLTIRVFSTTFRERHLIMHHSISVTLFLMAAVLVPRQARAAEPITTAVVAILGTASATADLVDRVSAWSGLTVGNDFKLNKLHDKDLVAAKNFMAQYKNAPKNKELLKQARIHFTKAVGMYKGSQNGTVMYKHAVSLLGLSLCCEAENDPRNARVQLVQIAEIEMLPESGQDTEIAIWLKRTRILESQVLSPTPSWIEEMVLEATGFGDPVYNKAGEMVLNRIKGPHYADLVTIRNEVIRKLKKDSLSK